MRVYIAQLISSRVLEDNLRVATKHIEAAAAADADIVILPEAFALFGGDELALAKQEGDFCGPVGTLIRDLAARFKLWVLAGTVPILGSNSSSSSSKPRARAHLVNDQGQIHAYYDKIHLFDAEPGDKTGGYRESDKYQAGTEVIVCDSPWGRIGISVCYDLRFPELYRQQAILGADYFFVPAAFTWLTGSAHWEILCRARAIENGCFLFASNQGGEHDNGRRTWGRSMLVNPWGDTQSLAEGEGQLLLNIDKNEISRVRKALPCHQHHVL